MTEILIPISPGELLDKITILEIKSERIESAEKRANVTRELGMLDKIWSESITTDTAVYEIKERLKAINEALWAIEDAIRIEEKQGRFKQRFIELARAVYVTNDQRAEAKKELNIHLKSDIVEEKSYQDYS